jgi:hypothetical protein
MADRDEVVSDEVIAKLWPEPDTRPEWAKRCSRCGLIYTTALHKFECPESKEPAPKLDPEPFDPFHRFLPRPEFSQNPADYGIEEPHE